MMAATAGARALVPVWRHLRHANWPVLPLLLAALLYLLRLWGAQSYAYWNDWLSCFASLLAAYSIVACLRILLQSLCFDNALACWLALPSALILGWPFVLLFNHQISRYGVPTASLDTPMLLALVAACLLVVPLEIMAERTRWSRRAARREREQTMERQLLEARLTALQRQIEPHFLYNTLANARALIRQDSAAAEQLLLHLIHFLRSAIPDLRAPHTTLGAELERARTYLEIFKMRFGQRLRFEISASEQSLACMVPPLSVMTLVENAVEHGIEPRVEGGSVEISAVCADGRLRIEVLDNGAGFQTEQGAGLGLSNLQARLSTLYGDAAELRLEPRTGGGIRAAIELPVTLEGKA